MPNTIPFNQIKPYVEECLPGWAVVVHRGLMRNEIGVNITGKTTENEWWEGFSYGLKYDTRRVPIKTIDGIITDLILWTETLEIA